MDFFYPNSDSSRFCIYVWFFQVLDISSCLFHNISAHVGFHPPRLQDPAWPGSHSVLQQRLRSVSQDGWCLDRRWPPWSNHRKIGILPMTLVVEWAWRYGRNITNNNPIGTIWWILWDFTGNKSENRMIIGEYIGSIMAIQCDGGYDYSRFWGIQWQFKEPPNLWCRHRFHGLDLEILNVIFLNGMLDTWELSLVKSNNDIGNTVWSLFGDPYGWIRDGFIGN